MRQTSPKLVILCERHENMSWLAEGLVARAVWEGLRALFSRILGRRIEITSPRSRETLLPILEGSTIYQIDGRLRRIPRSHQIWLLLLDTETGKAWPQGFRVPDYDAKNRNWQGQVNRGTLEKDLYAIVAVVAPPTSQMLFRYYQEQGSKTNWAPIAGIPEECWNRAEVHARFAQSHTRGPNRSLKTPA